MATTGSFRSSATCFLEFGTKHATILGAAFGALLGGVVWCVKDLADLAHKKEFLQKDLALLDAELDLRIAEIKEDYSRRLVDFAYFGDYMQRRASMRCARKDAN